MKAQFRNTYSSNMMNVVDTGDEWMVNGFLDSRLTWMLSIPGSYSTIGNLTKEKE